MKKSNSNFLSKLFKSKEKSDTYNTNSSVSNNKKCDEEFVVGHKQDDDHDDDHVRKNEKINIFVSSATSASDKNSKHYSANDDNVAFDNDLNCKLKSYVSNTDLNEQFLSHTNTRATTIDNPKKFQKSSIKKTNFSNSISSLFQGMKTQLTSTLNLNTSNDNSKVHNNINELNLVSEATAIRDFGRRLNNSAENLAIDENRSLSSSSRSSTSTTKSKRSRSSTNKRSDNYSNRSKKTKTLTYSDSNNNIYRKIDAREQFSSYCIVDEDQNKSALDKQTINSINDTTENVVSKEKDTEIKLENNETNDNKLDDAKSIVSVPTVVQNEKVVSEPSKTIDEMPNDTNSLCETDIVENSSKPTAVMNGLEAFFYVLKVKLKEGKQLAIRDIGGSSDPYAKFILNNECVYKSKTIYKNLNPVWNEEFMIKLPKKTLSKEKNQTIFENTTLNMIVYDYDRGFLNDDLIGYTLIDIDCLDDNIETAIELELKDSKVDPNEQLGFIYLTLTLIPKYENEVDQTVSLAKTQLVRTKRTGCSLWYGILHVLLIEGSNLISMDDNGYSDPYIKFRLGIEKYRSRTIRRSLNPVFLEQFQMYIYDETKMTLTFSVYDYDSSRGADDFMGKASLDLKAFDIEKTYDVRVPLEDGAGEIHMLVTITGIYGNGTDPDYNKEMPFTSSIYYDNIIREYGLANSLNNIDDVGWLRVRVIRALDLASADINGKSDPFCTLQIINQYVQTHTEYKTLNPEWGKYYEFRVNDIHAVLEVTVFDEDKNKVYEFLGKIEIPLLSIQNGKRKLYALKDRKLVRRTKGAIELELHLVYNPLKAIIRTFNPREEKFFQSEPKFKINVLKQNIMRLHNVVQGFINTGSFIESCFNWDSPFRSIVTFLTFIIMVTNFELYMLPLTVLVIFFKNYIFIKLKSANVSQNSISVDDETVSQDAVNFDYDEEDESFGAETESKQEPKKTFRARLNEIQEICLKIQEALDYIASLAERVINTFNFTVPWLSFLAIFILMIASLILYLVPLRYLILAYGINKFTKKFRKPPGYIDNNELLDFLSRVPSKTEQFHYKEFRVWEHHGSINSNTVSSTESGVKKKKK